MKVSDYMTRGPMTALATEGAADTFRTMQMLRIRHIPVVDKLGLVAGMVSDRDLRRPKWLDNGNILGTHFVLDNNLLLGDVMTAPVTAVMEHDSLVLAARILMLRGFCALPVVNDEGDLVGILSQVDIVRAYYDANAETDFSLKVQAAVS